MNLLLAGSIGLSLDKAFLNLDMSIFTVFGNIQNSILTAIAKVFTAMGTPIFIILLGVLGLILCFFKKTRRVGFAMVFAVIIGTLLTNILIKPFVARVRPYNTLQDNPLYWKWYLAAGRLCESDFCFPSGHTTGAMEVAIALMLCHIKAKKKAVCWIFPLVALLVGASRIYLMVHYPTDIFGGIIIGCIAGVLGYIISNALIKFLRNNRLNRKLDLTRKFKNGISPVVAGVLIAVAYLAIFAVSYLTTMNDGGPKTIRCAYDREYDCQNEAKVDSKKYPPIEGKEYCKIHWKQLSKEFAETGTIADKDTYLAQLTQPETETQAKPEPTSKTDTTPAPNPTPKPEPAPAPAPVATNDVFNHYGMTGFRDNFYNERPSYLVWYKAGDGEEYVYSEDGINRVFEILKGTVIGGEDTSGEIILDQEIEIAFVMEDGTEYKVEFDAPDRIVDGERLFHVDNNNGIYDFNIYDFV